MPKPCQQRVNNHSLFPFYEGNPLNLHDPLLQCCHHASAGWQGCQVSHWRSVRKFEKSTVAVCFGTPKYVGFDQGSVQPIWTPLSSKLSLTMRVHLAEVELLLLHHRKMWFRCFRVLQDHAWHKDAWRQPNLECSTKMWGGGVVGLIDFCGAGWGWWWFSYGSIIQFKFKRNDRKS